MTLEERSVSVYESMSTLRDEDVPIILGALRSAYREGMLAAADYVDGNRSDAHTMAAHLRAVANGDKPLYAD